MAVHKILLLDDDPDVLELFEDLLARLPSKPEVHTATSGARALSLLETQPFTLLISDLKMPKMDGLQVLTIVRRKFPQLRTAVMTGIADEQFRARAYAVGVDLFLEKPQNETEVRFFLDCIESLLGREEAGGFRGIQSKSLVDLIQLECLSQSSSVLKISNGPSEGFIWLQNGSIVDAAVGELSGESAFQQILSWKTGNFELLPPDPQRERRIFTSAQGLLLETAQALDESQAAAVPGGAAELPAGVEPTSPLAKTAQIRGVESVLALSGPQHAQIQSWGGENADQIAAWTRQTVQSFRWLGDALQAGEFQIVECRGPQRHSAVGLAGSTALTLGLHRSLSSEQVRETLKTAQSKWVS